MYILIALIFFSCEEYTDEIDYKTIYNGDKIIVHGFISPQTGVQVIIKKSVPPNNLNASDTVNNAVITLYQNGTKLCELNKKSSYLFTSDSNLTIDSNSNYYIKAKADNLETILSCSQPIFEPVKIDSMRLIIDTNSYNSHIAVSFYDKKEFGETYYLKLLNYKNGVIDTSSYREIFNPFGIIENTTKGVNTICEQTDYHTEFDSIRVELYTLSPDLGLFLKSEQNYDDSKDDPFYEITYPVYSNITNGYGVFASYSIYSEIIKKPCNPTKQ